MRHKLFEIKTWYWDELGIWVRYFIMFFIGYIAGFGVGAL